MGGVGGNIPPCFSYGQKTARQTMLAIGLLIFPPWWRERLSRYEDGKNARSVALYGNGWYTQLTRKWVTERFSFNCQGKMAGTPVL